MADSDEIEDIIVLSPDDLEEEEQDGLNEPVEVRPKSSKWPLWLGGGFIVGLVAASVGSWFFRPVAYDPQPLEQQLTELQAELESVKRDLRALEGEPDPVIPTINLSPLEDRIADLEARPTVDPLNEEIVSRMEALQAEGFELPEVPEFPDLDALNARISNLEAEIVRIDSEPREAAPKPDAEVLYVDPQTLPNFPAQALRQGAAELSGDGFFRRTFSRHVRLKGDTSPSVLIDGIEVDMAAGNPEGAIAKFDQLPESLQSLARAWRADMEDALP